MSNNQESGRKRGPALFIPNNNGSNNGSGSSIITVSEQSVSSDNSKSKPPPTKRQHTNSRSGTNSEPGTNSERSGTDGEGLGAPSESSKNGKPGTNKKPVIQDKLGINPTLDDYIKYYKENEISSIILEGFLLKKSDKPDAAGGSGRFYTIKYGMKIVDRSKHPKETHNEIRALRILNANHCNYAPRLISVAQKGNKVYLLMTYTDGKTLKDWLKTNPSDEQKKVRSDELKEGLKQIHSFDFIHADIKPENIWIPDDPEIPAYFIDFGSSIKEGEPVVSVTITGIALGSNSASKEKDTADLDRLFPGISGGGKTRRNRKKLIKTRRYRHY